MIQRGSMPGVVYGCGQTPAPQGLAMLQHHKVVFDIASPSIIMPECVSLTNSV